MKKILALLLAAAMLLSLTACGGSAEPVETAPATTEPAVVETEAPTEVPADALTEEPTEAPTEPRVAPVDFESVDPKTLPKKPEPVEEQLLSEDTQTVTLDSLEEYEDLLWSLGFQEVRLTGQHDVHMMETDNTSGFNKLTPASAYCEPVSLTYNENAFRFDFTYCMVTADGRTTKEDGWSMYGTKSAIPADVSKMTAKEYEQSAAVKGAVGSGDVFTVTIDGTQFGSEGQAVQSILDAIAKSGNIQAVTGAPTQVESKNNPNYTEDNMQFTNPKEFGKTWYVKLAYYTITGNLYNYMRDPGSEGTPGQTVELNLGGAYQGMGENVSIGFASKQMCFHYLFPAEDAAE